MELAKPFDMTQPAISQHLKVLEDAGVGRLPGGRAQASSQIGEARYRGHGQVGGETRGQNPDMNGLTPKARDFISLESIWNSSHTSRIVHVERMHMPDPHRTIMSKRDSTRKPPAR